MSTQESTPRRVTLDELLAGPHSHVEDLVEESGPPPAFTITIHRTMEGDPDPGYELHLAAENGDPLWDDLALLALAKAISDKLFTQGLIANRGDLDIRDRGGLSYAVLRD